MSNLYRLDSPAKTIADIFGADPGVDPWDGGYVAPGKYAPVITGETRMRMIPARWGFPPPPAAVGNRLVTNGSNIGRISGRCQSIAPAHRRAPVR